MIEGLIRDGVRSEASRGFRLDFKRDGMGWVGKRRMATRAKNDASLSDFGFSDGLWSTAQARDPIRGARRSRGPKLLQLFQGR